MGTVLWLNPMTWAGWQEEDCVWKTISAEVDPQCHRGQQPHFTFKSLLAERSNFIYVGLALILSGSVYQSGPPWWRRISLPVRASRYSWTKWLKTSLGMVFSSGRHCRSTTTSAWPTACIPFVVIYQHFLFTSSHKDDTKDCYDSWEL